MTRTVGDAAVMLSAMAGHDPKDSTSAAETLPDLEAGLEGGVKGLRIGVPAEYRVDGMPSEIEAIWSKGIAWLRDAGAEIVDISLPHTPYALPTYYLIPPAEAPSNLARHASGAYALWGDDGTPPAVYPHHPRAGMRAA